MLLYLEQWNDPSSSFISFWTFAFLLFQSLADEEPEKYQTHFSEYIKRGISADDMEAVYKKVHAAIRADPTMAKSTKEPPKTHKRYSRQALHHTVLSLFTLDHCFFSTLVVSCIVNFVLDAGTTPRSWPMSRGRPVWSKGSTPSTTLPVPPMTTRTTTSEDRSCPPQCSLATCVFVKVWHSAQRTCSFEFWLSCWSYRLCYLDYVPCWHLDLKS